MQPPFPLWFIQCTNLVFCKRNARIKIFLYPTYSELDSCFIGSPHILAVKFTAELSSSQLPLGQIFYRLLNVMENFKKIA